jgi:hypothetical protein
MTKLQIWQLVLQHGDKVLAFITGTLLAAQMAGYITSTRYAFLCTVLTLAHQIFLPEPEVKS